MPLRVLTTRGCRLVPRRGAPGPWCAGRRHGRGATLRFVRAVVTTGRELEAQPVAGAGAGAGAKATHLSPGASEQRAHAACAGGRTPRAERWPGTRLRDHGACARCGIPVPRQRILESTNWERASAERPGDHGACGRVRKPGEARAYENRVVGGCRVIMGRALKVGSPLRGNGFSNRPTGHAPAGSDRVCMAAARSAGSPRCAVAPGLDRWARAGGAVALVIMGRALDAGSPFHDNGILESTNWERASAERPGDHGACGRVRKPGEARAYEPRCRWVPGDHGACAQGRIPVTWQRILESTDWARASGERQGVHGGRAVCGLASLCGGTRA